MVTSCNHASSCRHILTWASRVNFAERIGSLSLLGIFGYCDTKIVNKVGIEDVSDEVKYDAVLFTTQRDSGPGSGNFKVKLLIGILDTHNAVNKVKTIHGSSIYKLLIKMIGLHGYTT